MPEIVRKTQNLLPAITVVNLDMFSVNVLNLIVVPAISVVNLAILHVTVLSDKRMIATVTHVADLDIYLVIVLI